MVVSEVAPEAVVHRSGVEQRIDVVILFARTDIEKVIVRINVRFGFIEPDVVEPIGLHIAISDLFPPPAGSIGVGRVDVGTDHFGKVPLIGSTVGRADKPALFLQHVVELRVWGKVRPHA